MSGGRWRWLGRGVLIVFLGLVAALLVRHAGRIDWREVRAALAAYDAAPLAAAAALAAASYALYAGYDLAARRYAGHRLGRGRVGAIALISYAFNLNLGALVGGAGIRYRLYLRAGLAGADIGRVLGFSVVTNWLGYALVAGVLFSVGAVPLPRGWELGTSGMRVFGGVLLLFGTAYLVACSRRRGRSWQLRGQALALPSLPLALLQCALGAGNWLVIAAIHMVLLRGEADYALVLGATLLAAAAAAMTHIPAGIGALEVVFLALLGATVAAPEVLAALLVYRALYYLAPLAFALAGYLLMEFGGRRAGAGLRTGGR